VRGHVRPIGLLAAVGATLDGESGEAALLVALEAIDDIAVVLVPLDAREPPERARRVRRHQRPRGADPVRIDVKRNLELLDL
jgi:hypothetical protein